VQRIALPVAMLRANRFVFVFFTGDHQLKIYRRLTGGGPVLALVFQKKKKRKVKADCGSLGKIERGK